MVRPLRIEFSGAVYHVTSRGDRREPIAKDDQDRQAFLSILAQGLDRFDAAVLAYCLMGNHYHLVLTTRQANLSRLMRQINGVYTQAFNRRHGVVGHLFQGRFKAILVDSDSYLLEVCRYVDLNPVRAQMCQRPDAYPWSSYSALSGLCAVPQWLNAEALYEQLLPGRNAAQAAAKYTEFVAQANDIRLWDTHLKQQIYLGDETFVDRMQKLAGLDAAPTPGQPTKRQTNNISKIHTTAPQKDSDVMRYVRTPFASKAMRNLSVIDAFYKGGHSQTAIAIAFKVSSSTVSRILLRHEQEK